MLRRCDGNDPNLLRPIYPDAPNDQLIDGTLGGHPKRYRPCDCGKVFDDVNTTVIYPHDRF